MNDRLVGIVTINDDTNYGNRLQNFALQEVLRSLGWEPETIVNRPPPWERSLTLPRLAHDVRHDPRGVLDRSRSRLPRPLRGAEPPARPFLEVRRSAISEFVRERIRTSPHAFSARPGEYWRERYARAIVGSDQVWNPTYRRAQGIDFLDFIDEPARIAYAPSFGVRRIPGYLRARYREWLEGIPHLSVRETAGTGIVQDLTGRRAPVVLDPTALLPRSEWDRLIEDRAPVHSRPYCVRFFLGHTTPGQDAWIAEHAARHGLDIVDLHALDRPEHADVDPAGFVGAIARADAVYTDSFHAATFGLLYRQPLVLGRRHAGDARQEELLSQNGLSAEPTGIDGLRVVADVDWPAVEARRELLRSASTAFLRGALGEPDRTSG